jgi:hypothetical protein
MHADLPAPFACSSPNGNRHLARRQPDQAARIPVAEAGVRRIQLDGVARRQTCGVARVDGAVGLRGLRGQDGAAGGGALEAEGRGRRGAGGVEEGAETCQPGEGGGEGGGGDVGGVEGFFHVDEPVVDPECWDGVSLVLWLCFTAAFLPLDCPALSPALFHSLFF